jgi:hypothetical protein
MLPTSVHRTSANQVRLIHLINGQLMEHWHTFKRSLHIPDPFSQPLGASLVDALLATALFRCWYILVFFTGWATLVALVSIHVKSLAINPVLLTVCVHSLTPLLQLTSL